MDIHKATADYEKWKGQRTRLIAADLKLKHEAMASSVFPFFRATFYRWLQLWEEVCPEEAAAPRVLAVGDLHVENFGTWRDSEGRLVWGINDFDEAYPMSYAIDLVRLTTSAHLAIEEEHLSLKPRRATEAIWEGYAEGLESGGRPFVLGERHRWLRLVALNRLRDPVRFWDRMEGLPDFREPIPAEVQRRIESLLPERGMAYRRKRRVSGLGSLGHLRVVALGEWHCGLIAREAKALAPSAWVWASGKGNDERLRYEEIISRAARVPDPFLCIEGNMMYRRLAPDCSRIPLATLPKDHDEARLLRAMGFETANVHAGSKQGVAAMRGDFGTRPEGWLHRAAKRMAKAVRRDWKDWRKEYR